MYLLSGVDEDEAEEKVAARIERQAILGGDDPVHLTVLIEESVLHRLIGNSREHGQAARASDRDVPAAKHHPADSPGSGCVAGLNGAFDIASGPGIPDTMRMDAVEDQITDSRELVRMMAAVFEQIRGHALNVEESRAAIVEAINRWKSEQ